MSPWPPQFSAWCSLPLAGPTDPHPHSPAGLCPPAPTSRAECLFNKAFPPPRPACHPSVWLPSATSSPQRLPGTYGFNVHPQKARASPAAAAFLSTKPWVRQPGGHLCSDGLGPSTAPAHLASSLHMCFVLPTLPSVTMHSLSWPIRKPRSSLMSPLANYLHRHQAPQTPAGRHLEPGDFLTPPPLTPPLDSPTARASARAPSVSFSAVASGAGLQWESEPTAPLSKVLHCPAASQRAPDSTPSLTEWPTAPSPSSAPHSQSHMPPSRALEWSHTLSSQSHARLSWAPFLPAASWPWLSAQDHLWKSPPGAGPWCVATRGGLATSNSNAPAVASY